MHGLGPLCLCVRDGPAGAQRSLPSPTAAAAECTHADPRRRYREAFEALGTTLEAQGVQLDRVGPAAYRVWFAGNGGGSGSSGGTSGGGSGSSHGSSHLDLLNDEAAMAAQLEGAERGAGEGFRCGALPGRRHGAGRRSGARHGACQLGRAVQPCPAQDPRPPLPALCSLLQPASRPPPLAGACCACCACAPAHGGPTNPNHPPWPAPITRRRFLRMARMHLRMGVPYFIDRDFEELANARGLQVGGLRCDPGLGSRSGAVLDLLLGRVTPLNGPRSHPPPPTQDLLPFLPELNVLDLLGQHDWRLRQFFADPRLRAMFTFQVGCRLPCLMLAGAAASIGAWVPALRAMFTFQVRT